MTGRFEHNKIIFPKGIMNGITFCFATLISVLFINCLGYFYLEAQPVRLNATYDAARSTLPAWHGLLELPAPVGNIILGDSTAGYNLMTGPITDRLGGSSIILSNSAGSSILADAWMIEQYMQRWDAPKNVFLLRHVGGYEVKHNLEFMAAVPLGWGYWDNIPPNWEKNELVDLFIKKYTVIYSNSDILSDRLLNPTTIFNQPYQKTYPSLGYYSGNTEASDMDNLLKNRPAWLYGTFNPSIDSTTALKFMSKLAEERGFNLYIIAGTECDEMFADPSRRAKVSNWYNYVTQFAKSKNVYVVPDAPLQFKKELMQNPNHLRPGAAKIYTETIIDDIVSLQNTASKDIQLKLISTKFDKSTYYKEGELSEIPSLTVSISDNGTNEIRGAVSCSIFKSGTTDDEWVRRASAVNFNLANTRTTEVKLVLDKGNITEPGKYDVAIFVRIDEGKSIKEIKFIVPNILEGAVLYE